MNFTAPEKQEKPRSLTLRVVPLQNKKIRYNFLGHPVHEHFIKIQV